MDDDISDWLMFDDGSLCAPTWRTVGGVEQVGINFVMRFEWDYKGSEDSAAAEYVRDSMERMKRPRI